MPTAAETEDALQIANRLRPVLLRLGRRLRHEAHALGVTGGQATLLAVIQSSQPIALGELATGEGVSSAAMSKHVDRLQSAGLVSRGPSSSGDRRRVGIRLTRRGEDVLGRIRTQRTAWLAARLEQLRPRELAAIERAIEPLAMLLEDAS